MALSAVDTFFTTANHNRPFLRVVGPVPAFRQFSPLSTLENLRLMAVGSIVLQKAFLLLFWSSASLAFLPFRIDHVQSDLQICVAGRPVHIVRQTRPKKHVGFPQFWMTKLFPEPASALNPS